MSKTKVGQYFPNELGPDGKPTIPDDSFLVASYDDLWEWYEADDDRPLVCRVVLRGTPEWDDLKAAKDAGESRQ